MVPFYYYNHRGYSICFLTDEHEKSKTNHLNYFQGYFSWHRIDHESFVAISTHNVPASVDLTLNLSYIFLTLNTY
jgi:hypothetical protein